VDANGQSQYAKDFNKNMVKNLIESAYLTMKGDALISSAKHTGETSANQKLRQLMRNSSKNHSSYSVETKQKSLLDLASGLL
jgi:predicted TIM-barrel enzyme